MPSLVGPRNGSDHYYRPELDVVRFLAFFFVFLYHFLPDAGDPRVVMMPKFGKAILDAIAKECAFGMSLFFALSAFLICQLLIREKANTGTVSIKQFYIRRILRIWPLYYLGLLIGAIALFVVPGTHFDAVTLGWYAVFGGAWRIALYGPTGNPMNVLWSISVEEQFYLIAPCSVKFLSRKVLTWSSVLLIAASLAWLGHLGSIGASDDRIWFDTIVQFQCFSAGILLCILLNDRIPQFLTYQRVLLFGAAMLCWFSSTFFFNSRFRGLAFPGVPSLVVGYALATIGTILILLAFLGVAKCSLPNWAIYLGRVSFGLYVFHELVIHIDEHFTPGHRLTLWIPSHIMRVCASGIVDMVLCFAVTVAIASISYRYFEKPFLRMKSRFAVVKSDPENAQRSEAVNDRLPLPVVQ